VTNDGFDEHRVHSATFLVEVDGVEIGRFMDVSGLEVEVEVIPLVEGGENNFVHKLPGRMTWVNLVLKRGITQNDSLLEWLNKSSGEGFAANGNSLRHTSAAITLVGPSGTRIRKWDFFGAFPVKWRGPNFSVGSNEMATEELEIAHHGFRVEDF